MGRDIVNVGSKFDIWEPEFSQLRQERRQCRRGVAAAALPGDDVVANVPEDMRRERSATRLPSNTYHSHEVIVPDPPPETWQSGNARTIWEGHRPTRRFPIILRC